MIYFLNSTAQNYCFLNTAHFPPISTNDVIHCSIFCRSPVFVFDDLWFLESLDSCGFFWRFVFGTHLNQRTQLLVPPTVGRFFPPNFLNSSKQSLPNGMLYLFFTFLLLLILIIILTVISSKHKTTIISICIHCLFIKPLLCFGRDEVIETKSLFLCFFELLWSKLIMSAFLMASLFQEYFLYKHLIITFTSLGIYSAECLPHKVIATRQSREYSLASKYHCPN